MWSLWNQMFVITVTEYDNNNRRLLCNNLFSEWDQPLLTDNSNPLKTLFMITLSVCLCSNIFPHFKKQNLKMIFLN